GARDGILIKGGEFLEASAKIDAVALDKTGTLTEGRPHLTDVIALNPEGASGHPALDADDVLWMAARAEAGSEHPLARPILDAAAERGLRQIGLPEQTEPVPGKGIVATFDGHRIAVGNMALIESENTAGYDDPRARSVFAELAAAGRTPMLIARDGQVIGVIAVADRVRADAPRMVAQLRAVGVKKILMLTGDIEPVARAVGERVGIDEIRAGLLPEEKLDAVNELQRQGYTVAMMGDGVNDAAALATATIGVAMGAAGSAVAIETADIALMTDDLVKLPHALSLARRTVNTMRQNIAIALGTVGVLMLGVLLGGVTMAIGMLVHELSVLVVILNAMRLLRTSSEKGTLGGNREVSEGIDVENDQPSGTRGAGDPRLLELT
ncbi:MAG: HAD-IC family P-type ATPase, partial [Ruaniaceae bacterium]|nr:HAD-IC family P-type ATPase [Ruaniaceae bacterium]